MRLLLVGNYALDGQTSMLRYAEMLREQMRSRGHEVELVHPAAVFGAMGKGIARKWLRYVDKYLIFPWALRARVKSFDEVHVCDHSNAMYLAHTRAKPSSMTCHDLLAIGSARGWYGSQRISLTGKLLQGWILKHLAAAKNVVCVSANTARELEQLTSTADRNVVVIPNALNYGYAPKDARSVGEMRAKLGITEGEDYLLHIGGDHWYKNRPGTFRIFRALDGLLEQSGRERLRLVAAGQAWPRELREYVAAHGLGERIIEAVDPSNEELATLYTGATALFFPSLHEGFGWPLIEAQSCGCPVITSNRPPMTEIAGEAALYIDPGDEQGAAVAIAENLDKLPLLCEGGFRNVKRYLPEIIMPAYEEFFRVAAESFQPRSAVQTASEA